MISPLASLAAEADAGAPFGMLPLVDEVDCGDPGDPHAVFEDPAGASQITTILGRSARAMTMDTSAKVFAYKIGAGKGLVAGKAYLLSVEYPEDTGRQIVIINRGAELTRTLATGQTIGDARESYTYPSPESLRYPLSQKWEAHRTLFFLHDRFQGIKASRDAASRVFEDTPETGFWVIIGQFRLRDSPLDAGAAVARIRLFEVPDPDAFDQPIVFPPDGLPRRHISWREEMADGIIEGTDPSKRGVSESIDWYDYKMRLARFLGIRTFTKDLLEFGHNQNWDTSPYGGNAWMYMGKQPGLWSEIVSLATSHGMDVLPYYEYAGAKGGGSGGVDTYGFQRHCRPLGDRTGDRYTNVSWSEDACIDLTEQAARDDVQKVLDGTVTRFKDQASFAGVWFRTRPSNWPISFRDETLARFGAEANDGTTPTRAQLQAEGELLQRYYAWWLGKRRDYLVWIRDYLRTNVQPDAQVLFTAYPEEALRTPTYADWYTPTDDVATWTQIHTQPGPWQWRFKPAEWQPFVDDQKFLEMITRMTPPTADELANHDPEQVHSTPPADPSRYKDVDGVFLAMPFSRLFTTSSAAQLEAFRAKDGLAIVRHFNLNEEDGQNPQAKEGPMSKKVGYFVTDVDRAGPYSMLAEARAVANGDPRFIGYLSSSSFNRGFPEYVRAFNAAFLALPALPSVVVDGAASDAEVVVRRIETPSSGTWFAVVNTSLESKADVAVTIDAAGTIRDLVADAVLPASADRKVTLSFYPGQLYALRVTPEEAQDAGTQLPTDGGADAGAQALADGGVDAGTGSASPVAGGCGCTSGADAWVAFALIAAGAFALRRRQRRA